MPLTWHSLFATTDGLAALGTLALACATLALALLTRSMASGTKQLAEATKHLAELTESEVQAVRDQADAALLEVQVSREALEASYQPRLTNVPFGLKDGPAVQSLRDYRPDQATIRVDTEEKEQRYITVPARNIGNGPALIQQVSLRWYELGSVVLPDETTYYGLVVPTVLPPEEQTRTMFVFGTEAFDRLDRLIEGGRFAVEFEYVDLAGRAPERTRLDIEWSDELGWRVKQVHFYAGSAKEAYVSSGVSG